MNGDLKNLDGDKMKRYKKPMRTKKMEIDLLLYYKGKITKSKFMKKYGISPGYCRLMYKPFKPKRRLK